VALLEAVVAVLWVASAAVVLWAAWAVEFLVEVFLAVVWVALLA
jgi:hypothetical protein